MKQIVVLICLVMLSAVSLAQQVVKPIKFSVLEQRYQQANDTTYVINFWATWCGPCVKELPNFLQLQNEFKTDKLRVILVSMDFRSKLETNVEPFVKKMGGNCEVVLLDEKDQGFVIDNVSEKWSGALPGTLIINKSKGIGSFYEQEFQYDELKKTYLNTKK
ncbi:TlpA disulfide reductase family protein [Solitalea koreensis]|uniref:AhpC/TSA family protein n=1 Tax=Solitalea koreensis TaxID=543615 RepID=A0A521D9Z7_9SPHI|nr:TlpA disulfide reductase family protein [Solitalea koreensis]SMO68529.1 AhpC/TSA family protein [Solitalea koreensis]